VTRALALAAAAGGLLVAADRDPLAGRVAGPPERCITLGVNDGPSIVDGSTILYRQGARLYRTGPRGSCPALRPFNTLIVEVYGGQLCANDRFRVLQPGSSIPSAPCLFTEFTPYTKAPSVRPE
jgi:hypothetical protein